MPDFGIFTICITKGCRECLIKETAHGINVPGGGGGTIAGSGLQSHLCLPPLYPLTCPTFFFFFLYVMNLFCCSCDVGLRYLVEHNFKQCLAANQCNKLCKSPVFATPHISDITTPELNPSFALCLCMFNKSNTAC